MPHFYISPVLDASLFVWLKRIDITEYRKILNELTPWRGVAKFFMPNIQIALDSIWCLLAFPVSKVWWCKTTGMPPIIEASKSMIGVNLKYLNKFFFSLYKLKQYPQNWCINDFYILYESLRGFMEKSKPQWVGCTFCMLNA